MSATTGTTMLDAALAYARREWPVFPLHNPVAGGRCSCGKPACRDVGKHPRTPRGFLDATTDEGQIRRWWTQHPNANIGTPTSAARFVIDAEAGAGQANLDALQAEHGLFPATTPIVASGGGGLHAYFTAPASVEIRCSVKKVAAGIDVRGTGGYTVLPPSRHASGRSYRWTETISTPPVAPGWLVEHILAASRPPNGKTTGSDDGAPIPDGRRNITLTQVAGRMRWAGLLPDEIETVLLRINDERCQPPLTGAEVTKIARSIGRYPAGDVAPPTDLSPSDAALPAAADPCTEVRDELAQLRAENAALMRQLAERDATIVALTQTILNPHLTHTEKVAAVSIARHAEAKRSGGQVEPDGRVVLSASEVADDWRPKPEPGEHIAPVNPDSGTAPHMPRSSARSVLDAALERDLVQGEKRVTIRRRKDGSTFKDWEYVVSPAASFADLLNPWASWRPDQPKQRKVRESRACKHCGEVHPITRVDYCAGCGGELARHTIEQPDAGENISPIRAVAKERYGRNIFSDEPPWLIDAPDPWDALPQPALFPLDDAPPGQSHHFSAD